QIADRSNHVCLRERFHHQRTLPQMVFGQGPVLKSAAAAGTEMLTDGVAALMAGLVDMDEMPPIRMAGKGFDRYRLAWQRVRHVNRTVCRFGDTVPAMAKAGNGEPLSHVSLRAGIRRCRRHLRSARG